MENRQNFISMLSLKEMALRRVGVAMCNKSQLFHMLATLVIDGYGSIRLYSYKIIQKLSNLQLPEPVKKQMMPILQAVCEEMARWKILYEAYFGGDISVHVFEKLQWTAAGTVDYRNTAEELVRSSGDLPDVANRFQLACFYCLEDYIPGLWGKLPVESKKAFYDGDISQIKEPQLQLFLPNVLRRAESMLQYKTFASNSLERAAILGNKTLVDYYLAGLTKEVKEASLVQAARSVIILRYTLKFELGRLEIKRHLLSSVSCHLLSLMTAEDQNRIFEELPCEVLSCFLDWPRQDLFSDLADLMWTFIPESKYEDLFWILYDGFVMPAFYFPDSFQEFFQRTPVNFRKLFVEHECNDCSFFHTFMSDEYTETIKVVLRNLDPSERVRLVFSGKCFRRIFGHRQHRWPVLEVFLRELNLTREEKRRLKKFIVMREGLAQWVNRAYKRVFEFLDEGEASAQSKRSSEDDTSAAVKRLCIDEEDKSFQ